MVEKSIRNAKEYPSKRSLWISLPKKIMYQTFMLILDYLQESNKIAIEDDRIIWIWDPEGIKKLTEKKLIIK
jgi:hypothetical protein